MCGMVKDDKKNGRINQWKGARENDVVAKISHLTVKDSIKIYWMYADIGGFRIW